MKTLALASLPLVSVLLVLLPGTTASPQRSAPPRIAPLRASVDAVFEQWNGRDTPGCGVGVSQKGIVVHEKGYGMANLETGAAITPATVFHVASVSKQFTAMGILLLAGKGLLSLDDEVRTHIPEWTETEHRITIRHLLTHTAGLRDVFLLVELASPRSDGLDQNAALVRLLARQRGLNAAPGTEYFYSNGAYTLLAEVVKRVSRESFATFSDKNIFRPLGMGQTHVHDDPSRIVRNRASGYSGDVRNVRVAVRADPGGLVGNTGMFTTVRDLLRWEANFGSAQVGDRRLLAAMQEPTVLAGGDKSSYGFGVQIREHRGLRTVGHGGGDPGYAAYVVRYPDHDLAVAVLCNLESIDATGLTDRVASLYLERNMKADSKAGVGPAARPRAAVSAEQLSSKVGLYRDPANEFLLRFSIRDGKLMGSSGAGHDASWELVPVSPQRFVIAGTAISIEFVPSPNGRPVEAHVIGERPKPEVFQRLDEDEGTAAGAELHAFTGDYRSPELDVTYTLAAGPSGLLLTIPGRSEIPLQAIFRDGFAGSLVGVIRFSRDAGGSATAFTVHTVGVRGLRFDRVKGS